MLSLATCPFRRTLSFVPRLLGCVFILAWSALLPAQLPDASSGAAGKLIFTKGESPSHIPLDAVLGESTSVIAGTLVPCAGCHGADGKGRPEGGIVPSDIRWSTLSRPYSTDDAIARRRPAYDIASLKRALREGVDPGGNELGIAMPRYRISGEDLDLLIEYLKSLGSQRDPGISATSIRVATVLPGAGERKRLGESFAELLRAYFDELNQQGGIYGRQLELEIISTEAAPQPGDSLRQAIARRNIFAVLGVVAGNNEAEIKDAINQSGAPLVDSYAARADENAGPSSRTYHLLSGLPQQTRALVKFSFEQLPEGEGPIAVIFPLLRQGLSEAAVQECKLLSCTLLPVAYTHSKASDIVDTLQRGHVRRVIFLGDGRELADLLIAASEIGWPPVIFQPGSLAGDSVFRLPSRFAGQLFLSFPTLPSDATPEAVAEYALLVQKHQLTPVQPVRELALLAAAKVFVEGLRRSGRDLSRDQLVTAFSSIYNFSTGLTPPVSFGTTRRVGALGAHVVKLDLKHKSFIPQQDWITP